MLGLDDFDNLTELLCGTTQSRDFAAYEGTTLFGSQEQQIKILLDLVAVLAFGDDLLRACRLQLPDLAVQILSFCLENPRDGGAW